ncbi:MAG: type IV secretion system DNA-binding domain-containing protein [Patescibacteria group bacterium]
MAEEQTNKEQPKIVSDPNVNYFACSNYRNQARKFGIKLDDRRRHMYVVGKTGMGKTTVLENMVLNDIYAGHGVGLVDPHGDFAEKIINFIPPERINDVVYFNPADMNYPIGFNILETVNPEHKHLVASGLMGVFKKIWPDVWSARMEYILNNTILALLDFPDTTLLGINRLLADDDYRSRVVKNLQDPVVRAFWETEFASYNDRYKQEAVAPIQNKIGQFLSAAVIRNIVAQVKSRINIREIMDSKKIFIMNLSKGRIGEDNSRLLGGMLITKIQLSAMERVDIVEKDRKDFFLYVDEFQNFATESFANILSEARKYRLDLIMAHQYMEQLDETVLAAVIGNVGTLATYRVGSTDAEVLVKEFAPIFTEEDLVNLPKYNIYLKLMIDGVASRPFSAVTLPPIGSPTGSAERVIRVTRERYGTPREKIEEKIKRWSGLEMGGLDEEEENKIESDKILSAPIKTDAPKKLGDFVKREPEQKPVPHTEVRKPVQSRPQQKFSHNNNHPKEKERRAAAPGWTPRPISAILSDEKSEEAPTVPVIKLNELHTTPAPAPVQKPAISQPTTFKSGQVVKLD